MSSDHHPSSSFSGGAADKIWIYHERQEALLCGQHALNNLVQTPGAFDAGTLAETALQLDAMEMSMYTGKDRTLHASKPSNNVDEAGNFSIQVLQAALQNKYPGLTLRHVEQEDLFKQQQSSSNGGNAASKSLDITDMQGFLCHKSDHWFAIRNIGGRYWDLNSTKEKPVVLGHFRLATEMKDCAAAGYTIFCIPSGLPTNTSRQNGGSAGATAAGQWYNMADLLGGSSSSSSATAWNNVGSGMRLDGKSTAAPAANPAPATLTSNGDAFEGLSEEDQLQLALQASLEPAAAVRSAAAMQQHQRRDNDDAPLIVPEEPAAGAPGAVQLQCRIGGKRVVRRFNGDDLVQAVYAFCRQQAGGGSSRVELRAGFPPKDLGDRMYCTIAQANLAGESVQCRII